MLPTFSISVCLDSSLPSVLREVLLLHAWPWNSWGVPYTNFYVRSILTLNEDKLIINAWCTSMAYINKMDNKKTCAAPCWVWHTRQNHGQTPKNDTQNSCQVSKKKTHGCCDVFFLGVQAMEQGLHQHWCIWDYSLPGWLFLNYLYARNHHNCRPTK